MVKARTKNPPGPRCGDCGPCVALLLACSDTHRFRATMPPLLLVNESVPGQDGACWDSPVSLGQQLGGHSGP